MKTSNEIDQVAKAVSLAQGQIMPASKSTVNPFFKSKYSTLAQIWEVIREPLSKNGLSVFQDVCSSDAGISISTRICHLSGQWIEFGPLDIPLNKKDAQAVGSATSYGKRYALSAAIGVVSEEDDDDGERAMGRQEKKQVQEDKPKLIGKNQWTELNQLIDGCDLEYQKNIWDYLHSQGIESFSSMDEKMYDKIKKGCLKHLESKKVS
jgi:hypothetical protein